LLSVNFNYAGCGFAVGELREYYLSVTFASIFGDSRFTQKVVIRTFDPKKNKIIIPKKKIRAPKKKVIFVKKLKHIYHAGPKVVVIKRGRKHHFKVGHVKKGKKKTHRVGPAAHVRAKKMIFKRKCLPGLRGRYCRHLQKRRILKL